MDPQTLLIYGRDGLKLSTYQWRAEKCSVIACLIHGFGEHARRYDHMAHSLNQDGITVFAMDCRGHGHSGGLRGHAPSLSLLLDDIEELLKLARAEYNDLPVFLFGHSMGGNLVLNYVLRKPTSELHGFIASSPWLRLAFQPPAWKLKLGRLIAKWLPRFRQSNDLEAEALSKDPEVVQNYVEDPLVNDRISAGLFTIITDAANHVLEQIHTLTLDGLLYHGDADRIIDFDTSRELASENPEKITWIPLSGIYHEPHNDLEKDTVLKHLKTWIKDKAKATLK